MKLTRCVALGALAIGSCAPVLKPAAMVDAQELLASRQFHEATPLAPQAASHARQLELGALEALQEGDRVAAELLAQLTAAAVHRTVVLARLARAEKRAAHAELVLSTEDEKLRTLQAQHAETAREIETLQVRANVLRDALPLAASEPASPQRQAARKEAARALATQARLLCLASELLTRQGDEQSSALQQRLVRLEARLDIETPKAATPVQATASHATPSTSAGAPPKAGEVIDEAVALRSACLKQLTFAGHAQATLHPESSPADSLLTELSEGRLSPARDDRGVVVTLALEPPTTTKADEWSRSLAQLAESAKRHPAFPLLLVVHASGSSGEASLLAKAADARRRLQELGVPAVTVASAGNRIPLVLPGEGSQGRNTRLEVVFVAPSQ